MLSRVKKCFVYSTAVAVLLMSQLASAVSLGGLADNLLTPTRGITQLMYGVSYVAGAGMMVMALIQYKAHRDNPTQVRLGTPIAFFIFAWVFLLLPYIAGHSSASQYVAAQQRVDREKAKLPTRGEKSDTTARPPSSGKVRQKQTNLLPPLPTEDKDWYQ